MNINPILIVLCGLPGSGKSTYCKNYINSDYIIISTDDYIEKVAKDQEKTYNKVFIETIKAANKEFKQKLEYYSNRKENIIIDRTNLTIKSRRKILSRFKNHEKTIIYFDVPFNVLQQRNKRPGKIFSNVLLEDMFNKLQIPTESEANLVTVR